MKILLAVTSLGVGGAERLLTALADQYVASGHEVMLVRFHGEAELTPSDSQVRLENLAMRRSPLGVLAAMWRFRRLVRAFRPDVVNSHLVHTNILTRLLRLVTPMPRLISSAHNTNEESRVRMLAYRLTDRLAELSTNVSPEAVEAFEQQGAVRSGRMIAIDNGINTQKFIFDATARQRVRRELGIIESTPLLLAVGRLWEPKDYPSLLRAFSKFQVLDSAPRLVIVGGGPLRNELESMADTLGISDRVSFLGVRHDVQALLSACDVYVMSSAWEGLPMVILEAMASQRLIVATDCGGIRTVLGETGIVVPTGDSAALGKAMESALSLGLEQRERLGAAARERVIEHYSLAATAERYLAVYRGDDLTSKE